MLKYLLGAAVALGAPTAALAQDFDGARAELRLGYETPTVSDDGDVYKIGSAVSYGAEIGYDFKVGSKVTFGPYASLEWSSVELEDELEGVTIDVGRNYQLGGRIGVGLGGVLGYAKLGYSNMKLSASDGTFSDSETQGGIGGALGVEGNVGKHAYWGIEGNYSDFGDFGGINLQRRQLAGKVGLRF